jgi:hypothetical protein
MKYCFLILSALCLLTACEKVETPKSNEEMLRDGKWKMDLDAEHGLLKEKPYKPNLLNTKQVDTLYSLVVLDGNGNPLPDKMLNDTTYLLHSYPNCLGDDYLVFRDGITGSLNTGGNKCPQGEVAETDIRWGFLNNYSQMYIYDAGNLFMNNQAVQGDVKDISADKFTIRYMVIDNISDIPKKDTSYYTATFKKF